MEYGKAKADEGLPIFNYSVAYDAANREPLFYEMYPGSINDVSQLTCMIDKVHGYGYRNLGFILDRGYFSRKNLSYMEQSLRDQSGARTGSKSFLRRILIFPCKKASKHSSAPKPFFCRASQNLIPCTNLDYLCFFPYFLFCFLQLVEFLSPELHARITRHTQVAARGYRNASDLRAIRQAGAFELLREKSPVERFQPF